MRTHRTPMLYTPILLLALLMGTVQAQSSANYKLEQHALNGGGRPNGGTLATSASFRVTLDSIGDGIAAHGLSGASYAMDVGFLNSHRPASEVQGLRFDDAISLRWDADPSAGAYNLYRAGLGTVSTLTYGGCVQQNLIQTETTDNDPVAPGDGFFYLVTAENRLAEEGTRGYRSNGAERTGTVCP